MHHDPCLAVLRSASLHTLPVVNACTLRAKLLNLVSDVWE